MASITSICNIALSNIGKGTIADLDEDSEEARQCALHFDVTLDAILQSFPWMFAKQAQSLAEVANTWPEKWRYSYARPIGCLKPIRIVPSLELRGYLDDVPYAVRETRIFCDLSPAVLEFTARIDDATKFPPLFQKALAWSLSAEIAMPLTRDQSLRKEAYQIAAQSLGAAQMADANEEPASWEHPSEFIKARD